MHNGYSGFTVGQRKGIGGGLPEPYYVLEIRPETREVVVGPRHLLATGRVSVGELNWLGPPPQPGTAVHIQIRYRSPVVPCRVQSLGADDVTLTLGQPAAAVTPGQSCVFFSGEEVLGGGRIRSARGPDRPAH